MITIKKQIEVNLQNEEEVTQIIDFERENNFQYEIIMNGLINANYLAKLLDKLRSNFREYEFKLIPKWISTESTDMHLCINFKKRGE